MRARRGATAASGGHAPARRRRTIAVGVLILACIVLLARVAPAAASGARWRADYFPNAALTTHEGKIVRFYDDLLKDKVVAIDFIYTHCQFSCPLTTARLAEVQRMLGDRVGRDIFFYSITLDPNRDTPAVLAAYARKYHVGPGWLFLTGKDEDLQLIARKLGFYFDRATASADGHTPMVLVSNMVTGQWTQISTSDNPRFLAMALRTFLDGSPNDARRRNGAPAPTVTRGESLFGARCAGCHTIGSGDRMGPDLLGVTRRRSRDWLARFIAAPDQMLAQGDPAAKALHAKYRQVSMPNLRLGEPEITAIIDYLSASDGSAAPAARRPRP